MTATYNFGTGNSDTVRLLISDTDTENAIFADSEISNFLTLEDSDVRMAAAMALETMASREALIQKRIRLMDLQTDGPSVAKELRERAKTLREQANAGIFDYAEMVHTDFQARQRKNKQAERGVI